MTLKSFIQIGDVLEMVTPLFEEVMPRKTLLLSDTTVYSLYGKAICDKGCCDLILVEPGEGAKSLAVAAFCFEEMSKKGIDRSSLVISLGGGCVTDLSGFVASCYMRGISIVHIPTTLMGMVDAAIGGKTALNLPSFKNLVGSFHLAERILIDPTFLLSLPLRELRSGLAEVVKYGIIRDELLFQFLETHTKELLAKDLDAYRFVIERSISCKEAFIEGDLTDLNKRNFLNFGHTFGHAIESATDYVEFTHGEAVSIGMCLAASLSESLGFLPKSIKERIFKLCDDFGLPTCLPAHLPLEKLVPFMKKDKKATQGELTFILICGFQDPFKLQGISKESLYNAIRSGLE